MVLKFVFQEFLKMLDLKSGQYVLDVGCGIGGSAVYMAQVKFIHQKAEAERVG